MPDPPPEPRRHAKRHMLSWLSDACFEAREQAGVTREQVAAAGHVGYSMVYRFETYADRWPRDIDQLLGAYANALGVRDARLLWLRAIEEWLRSGKPLELHNGQVVEVDGAVPAAALKAFEGAIATYAAHLKHLPPGEASPADQSSERG